MKKIIIVSGIVAVIASISGGVLGYSLAKKRLSPKNFSGMLYIDYRTVSDNKPVPELYLSQVDPELLTSNSEICLLKINRIRK